MSCGCMETGNVSRRILVDMSCILVSPSWLENKTILDRRLYPFTYINNAQGHNLVASSMLLYV